jgi:hypothetical protein
MTGRPCRVIRSVFALTILFLAPIAALAQTPCVDYGSYLHWIGSAALNDQSYDLDVEGAYAYAANYGRMYVADISDPAAPEFIFNAQNGAQGVDARGDRLFVAGYDPDLRVYDISNPAVPTPIGGLSLPESSYFVTVDGDYAYLSAERRFHIVDVTDLANPALVSTLTIPNNAVTAIIREGYAYLASNGSGLLVVSISDPANPAIVGTYARTEPTGGIALSAPYIFLAALDGGVQIIDVSDPFHPVLAGSIPTYPTDGFAYSITVIGALAYVHCLPFDGTGSVRVYDITNPLAAVPIGGILPGGTVVDAGGFACVAAPMELRTLATANPTSPPVLGGIDLGPGAADDVLAGESHAYAAAWSNGLRVIDYVDPANPLVVGVYDTPGQAQGIVVRGDLAYVADGPAGLQIIDVSSPASPSLVGSLDTYDAQGLTLSGPYAYIADGWGQFKVIQVSDPAAPALVGTSVGMPLVHAVEMFGSYVIASEVYEGRLYVVDVSVPAQPHVVASVYAEGVRDFAVNGVIVYTATQNVGLQVYDFTNPLHPVLLRTVPTPDLIDGLSLSGETLYVTGGYMGVQAYDVGAPSTPRLIGSADTPGKSRQVDVEGDYAFVTHESYGLKILPAHCANPAGISQEAGESAAVSMRAYPNPVAGPTNLQFILPFGATVELAVYDAGGRRIKGWTRGWSVPGAHIVRWDATDDTGRRVPNGVYQARLTYGGRSVSRSLVVVR